MKETKNRVFRLINTNQISVFKKKLIENADYTLSEKKQSYMKTEDNIYYFLQ